MKRTRGYYRNHPEQELEEELPRNKGKWVKAKPAQKGKFIPHHTPKHQVSSHFGSEGERDLVELNDNISNDKGEVHMKNVINESSSDHGQNAIQQRGRDRFQRNNRNTQHAGTIECPTPTPLRATFVPNDSSTGDDYSHNPHLYQTTSTASDRESTLPDEDEISDDIQRLSQQITALNESRK